MAPSLPHDADAERAVIGTILLDDKLANKVVENLTVEDFYLDHHRVIFRHIKELLRQGKSPDMVLLMASITDTGELEKAGGAGVVTGCANVLWRAHNVQHYVDILRDKTTLRRWIHALQSGMDLALNSNGSPETTLKELAALRFPVGASLAAGVSILGSCSTAELFAAQEKNVDWLCWPFAAVGLASILDALPKLGKTVLLLHGILASRENRPFLNHGTKPMRVCFVSEQSRPSLAMQAREVGFSGLEPIEELRWITREDWSRYVYADFLVKLEKEILEHGNYNCLIIDTLHTVARMEDEKDASEVNRLGNLTIDVATRNNLALALGRHDRKSGGDVGVSGRSSIQLSGLVDVILHLVRVANQPTQRKLELLGRVPGLPNDQIIELLNGTYLSWGAPETVKDKSAQVGEWLEEEPNLTGEQIVTKFASQIPPVEVSLATANRYKAEAKSKAPQKRQLSKL